MTPTDDLELPEEPEIFKLVKASLEAAGPGRKRLAIWTTIEYADALLSLARKLKERLAEAARRLAKAEQLLELWLVRLNYSDPYLDKPKVAAALEAVHSSGSKEEGTKGEMA